MFRMINNAVGTLSLGATTFAAAVYDEWPPYIAGAALGTLAFLWSIKGAAEDRRYKALTKRLDDSEAEIDAARRNREQVQEFYTVRIREIEDKNLKQRAEQEEAHMRQIAELEQAKLQIMLDLKAAQEAMKRDLEARVSQAKTNVAIEAASVKSAMTDASNFGAH